MPAVEVSSRRRLPDSFRGRLAFANSGSADRLTVDALDNAFRTPIAPVRHHFGYHFGLSLVTLATVLLPVVYVSLIAATGYAVFLHATRNTAIMSGGGGMLYRLIAYVGPMLVGGVLIVFMVKPLFARPARPPQAFELTEPDEPLLFAFIQAVRRSVGAPEPRTVVVDCNVNASASFRRGIVSFLGNDMTLTIGLPLVAGMSLRQLGGILAHEFGHFSQGSGMRMSYLIRSVNAWFARVVYERDEWDETLQQWSQGTDFRLAIVLWTSRFMVWLTRKVLWLLMMMGHAISSYMLRNMEYDADRYETRLVGSDLFESTALRLRMLTGGSQLALNALQRSWHDGRLCDDFPRLTVEMTERMPEEMRDAVAHDVRAQSAYDTHPPDAARVAAAKREAAPGVFHMERPATELVPEFETLSRRVTEHFYRTVHSLPVKPESLLPAQVYLQQLDSQRAEAEVANQYLGGLLSPLFPIGLPTRMPETMEPEAVSLASLRVARHDVERLRAAADARLEAASQSTGAESGRVRHSEDGEDGSPQLSEELRSELDGILEELRAAVYKRMVAVLSLLRSPEMEAKLPGRSGLVDEADAHLRCVGVLGEQSTLLGNLAAAYNQAGPLFLQASKDSENAELFEAAHTALTEVHRLMEQIEGLVKDVAYPFDHVLGSIDVAQFATADLPAHSGMNGIVLVRCQTFLERLFSLYERCVCRLANIARDVESAAEATPMRTEEPANPVQSAADPPDDGTSSAP